MRKSILTIAALACALIWTGCQRIEEELIQEKPEEPVEEVVSYTITVQAVKADGEQTKGLALGDGTEATTTELKSIWKSGEEVKVYLGTECIGTLRATPDGTDAHKATLSGTVTTTNIVAGTTTLNLLTPRESWDYTGQTGVLLASAGSIEKKYHYTLASSVLVTAVDGSAITTESATFANQQSIYRLSFRYNDGVTKTPLTTKSVTISSANGQLVQSRVLGGATTTGDISVTLGTASADPFFVALRNGDETNAEALTFTVVDAAGVTYRGSKTIPAGYKPNGTFVSVKNATLTERLQLPESNTEVTTAL